MKNVSHPKKRYLSFTELAARWNCSDSDLHHMIAHGEIVPSLYFGPEPRHGLKYKGGKFVGDVDGIKQIFDGGLPEETFIFCHHPMRIGPNEYQFIYYSEHPDKENTEQWYQQFLTPLIRDSMEGREKFFFMSEEIDRIENNETTSKDDVHTGSVPTNLKEVSGKSKASYLNIIGALVGLLLEKKDPDGNRFSTIKTQDELIAAIHHNYKQTGGLSQSNLEKKFADAKNSINNLE